MSEGKKRRVHTPEFKAKVGLEAVRGVKTVSEIAQIYGVHPVLVGQWKKDNPDVAEPAAPDLADPAESSGTPDALRITAYIAWGLENTGYRGPAVEKATVLKFAVGA